MDLFKPTDSANDIATVLVNMFSPGKSHDIAWRNSASSSRAGRRPRRRAKQRGQTSKAKSYVDRSSPAAGASGLRPGCDQATVNRGLPLHHGRHPQCNERAPLRRGFFVR
jgi:hypothetical protein